MGILDVKWSDRGRTLNFIVTDMANTVVPASVSRKARGIQIKFAKTF